MSTRSTRASYDCVAADYLKAVGDELASRPLERALLAALAELSGTGRLFDVGCGPGHVTRYLASIGADVIGTDLSPGMCVTGAHVGTGARYFAADMTHLPVQPDCAAGLVCLFAVIHLDGDGRAAAYREFARVLATGGHALVGFHTSDPGHAAGTSSTPGEWWGHEIQLTFRYLDAEAETVALQRAGFELVARLDRSPQPGLEHPSERSYLLVRRR